MKKSQSKVLVAVLVVTMVSTMLTFSSVQASTTGNTIIAHRISGADRYATANALSEKFTSADTVIIASGENFPDALCAPPLSKQYNAPILLSSSIGLTNETLAEIIRLKATKAIIVGGTGVISLAVNAQLTSSGVTPTRIGGKDRYETSLLVAKHLNSPTAVTVASGENFPDALSISGIASQLNMPIILSTKNGLSADAQTYIKSIGATKTYIIGGLGVLARNIDSEVTNPIRLAGADRYETNIKVLDQFKAVLNLDTVLLATGKDFPDALSGSALAGKDASPMLLIGNNLTTQKNFFNKNSIAIKNITVLGGVGAVTNATVTTLIHSSTIVMFQDKNLEQVVRKVIKKPLGVILKSEVNEITQLECSGISISNLSGLENFTNLTRLVLSPSTNDMSTGDVVNISALKELTKLTDLIVIWEDISDMDDLKEITSLTHLSIHNYSIFNMDDFKGITRLTSLYLYSSQINNVDALKEFTNLSTLSLNNAPINTVEALKGLTNLTHLELSSSKISNIDALKGLTNLTSLSLSNTQVSNIDPLKELTNLTNLGLTSNKIINIDALKELTNLTTLYLWSNKISNIDALKGLTNLTKLYLNFNQLSNIDALKELTNLTTLYLNQNQITDYTPVSSYYRNLIDSDFTLQ